MPIGTKSWRSNISLILLAAAVFSLLVFLITYEGCNKRCSDWDFAKDLLLGGTDNHGVRRWIRSPSVTVEGGNAAEIDMVRGAVFELNEVLSPTDMKVRFTQHSPADITVTFLSKKGIDFLRRQRGIDALIQGLCQPSVSNDGQLRGAAIFVMTNLSEGDKWGTVLHELGHAMGVSDHTDRYISSLFYENFKGGAISDRFSQDDRKLVEFLYRHVTAGANESLVRSAFEKHWVHEQQ